MNDKQVRDENKLFGDLWEWLQTAHAVISDLSGNVGSVDGLDDLTPVIYAAVLDAQDGKINVDRLIMRVAKRHALANGNKRLALVFGDCLINDGFVPDRAVSLQVPKLGPKGFAKAFSDSVGSERSRFSVSAHFYPSEDGSAGDLGAVLKELELM